MVDLDREILTINNSIHWKLDNIPRENKLWLRSIVESVTTFQPTVSPRIWPEEHFLTNHGLAPGEMGN